MRLVSVLVGLAVALGIGLTGGAVFADFSAHGSGSAVGVVGVPRPVTLDAAFGAVTKGLAPGGTSDLVLTLANPNPFALTVTGVQQRDPVNVVGGDGCTTANAGVSILPQTNLSITIASGVHSVTVPAGAAMSSSSASGCQGASFEFPVLVTVGQ
jgi:hypothetical protein